MPRGVLDLFYGCPVAYPLAANNRLGSPWEHGWDSHRPRLLVPAQTSSDCFATRVFHIVFIFSADEYNVAASSACVSLRSAATLSFGSLPHPIGIKIQLGRLELLYKGGLPSLGGIHVDVNDPK